MRLLLARFYVFVFSAWRMAALGIVGGSVFVAVLAELSPGSAQPLTSKVDIFYRDLHKREFVLSDEAQDLNQAQAIQHFGGTAVHRAMASVNRFLGHNSKIRTRSTLSWDSEGMFNGDWHVSLPLWHNYKQAILLQTGLNFWKGHRDETRLDINIGTAWRRMLGRHDVVGLNIFYDINGETEASRLGSGVEWRGRALSLALNGYLALSKWRAQGTQYEQRVVSGFDGTLGVRLGQYVALHATLGGWENAELSAARDSTESFGSLKLGAKVDMEVYLHPNLALHGAYDYDSYGVTDTRYHAGLRLYWPARERKLVRNARADMYGFVNREMRILYAERARIAPNARAPGRIQSQQGDVIIDIAPLSESDTDQQIAMTARLRPQSGQSDAQPLREDLVITLTPATATATHGTDYVLPASITIPAGETEAGGVITLKGDMLAEGAETLQFTTAHKTVYPPARGQSGVGIGQQQTGVLTEQTREFTIQDNDAPAYLALVPARGHEASVISDTHATVQEGQAIEMHYQLRRASDDADVLASHDITHALRHAPVKGAPQADTHYEVGAEQIRIANATGRSDAFRLAALDVPDTAPDGEQVLHLIADTLQPVIWLAAQSHRSTIRLTETKAVPRLLIDNISAGAGETIRLTRRMVEGAAATSLTIPMVLNTPIAQSDLIAKVAVRSAQANRNADFRVTPARALRFAKGARTPATPLTISSLPDAVAEDAESFTIRIYDFATPDAKLSEAFQAPAEISITVTIAANDRIASLVAVDGNGDALRDLRFAEDGGTGMVYYELRDANNTPVATPQAITIALSEIAVTGAPARNTHYQLSATSLTIAPGQARSPALRITGKSDAGGTIADNADRVLRLQARAAVSGTPVWYGIAADARAGIAVTITNSSRVLLRINNILYFHSQRDGQIRAREGTQLRIPIMLTRAIDTAITVTVRTRKGTAAASKDYTPFAFALNFAPGTTRPQARTDLVDASGQLRLNILNDTVAEGVETLTIEFDSFRVAGGSAHTVFGRTTKIAVRIDIAANDVVTQLVAVDGNGDVLRDLRFAEDGGTGVVHYELRDANNTPVAAPQSIAIALSEIAVTGAPARNTHYQLSATSLTIAPGQARSPALRITGKNDAGRTDADNADRVLRLQAHTAVSGTPAWHGIAADARTSIAVTITNSSGVLLRINNTLYFHNQRDGQINVREGEQLRIPIVLTRAHDTAITVIARTRKGTAAASKDYTPFAFALNFASGTTRPQARAGLVDASGHLLLDIRDDAVAEGAETLTIEFDSFRVAGGSAHTVFGRTTKIAVRINIEANDQLASLVAVDGDGTPVSALRLSEQGGQAQLYYEWRDANGARVQLPEPMRLTLNYISGTGRSEAGVHYRASPAQTLTFAALTDRSPAVTITGIDDNEQTAADRLDRTVTLRVVPQPAGSQPWYRIAPNAGPSITITLLTN